jgi:class 3 adenylate cyclase
MVAIKKNIIAGDSQGQTPRALLTFQEKASEIFKKAGGTVTGTEGDLVIACFGSPLEKVFIRSKNNPSPNEGSIKTAAQKAASLVCEIARRREFASWNFGIDMGNCNFAWSEVSGYFALGAPLQKAKVFSRLANRYKAQIVISASVNAILPGLPIKKLDVLKGKSGLEEEPFYQLVPETD